MYKNKNLLCKKIEMGLLGNEYIPNNEQKSQNVYIFKNDQEEWTSEPVSEDGIGILPKDRGIKIIVVGEGSGIGHIGGVEARLIEILSQTTFEGAVLLVGDTNQDSFPLIHDMPEDLGCRFPPKLQETMLMIERSQSEEYEVLMSPIFKKKDYVSHYKHQYIHKVSGKKGESHRNFSQRKR